MPATLQNPKVESHELADWLASEGPGTREVIIEASVPKRTAHFRPGPRDRALPAEIRGGDAADRRQRLADLASYVTDVLGTEPTVLSAAGALALEANARQLKIILDHPLVKAVRLNRTLRPIRMAAG